MIVKLVAKNKSYTNKDRPLKLSSFGVVKFIYLSVAILIETVLILVFYLLLKMGNHKVPDPSKSQTHRKLKVPDLFYLKRSGTLKI